MSLDTVGGFGGSHSPKKYLHILVDHFTRYAFILCSKGQSSREMISLIDSVHKRYPIGTLLTDQYRGLSSDEFQSYYKSAGISHMFVAVDCAFSNGLNKRLGQTLVNRIQCKHNANPLSIPGHGLLLHMNVSQSIITHRIVSPPFLLISFLVILQILFLIFFVIHLILPLIVK
jgi:hypothetical protein